MIKSGGSNSRADFLGHRLRENNSNLSASLGLSSKHPSHLIRHLKCKHSQRFSTIRQAAYLPTGEHKQEQTTSDADEDGSARNTVT